MAASPTAATAAAAAAAITTDAGEHRRARRRCVRSREGVSAKCRRGEGDPQAPRVLGRGGGRSTPCVLGDVPALDGTSHRALHGTLHCAYHM